LTHHRNLLNFGENFSFYVKESIQQIDCVFLCCKQKLVVIPITCDTRHVYHLPFICLSVQLFGIISEVMSFCGKVQIHIGIESGEQSFPEPKFSSFESSQVISVSDDIQVSSDIIVRNQCLEQELQMVFNYLFLVVINFNRNKLLLQFFRFLTDDHETNDRKIHLMININRDNCNIRKGLFKKYHQL
jgi:hypothetical protein